MLSLAVFTGCSGLNSDELYCLPQAPETYYNLQDALSRELSDGMTYLAPTSGTRQEPVQLVDLDSDGIDEAVAFLRSADGTVKTCIFANHDGVYEKSAEIDCAGSAVATVEYADLTGTGDLELLIACQVSETVTQAMQVCRYTAGEAVTLATVPCSRGQLVNLDGDSAKELVCFVDNGSEACDLDYYRFREGQLTLERELKLSAAFGGILDITGMLLTDGTPALAVTSLCGESQTVYDLYALRDDTLTALGAEEQSESAAVWSVSENIQGGVLYLQDVDEDGRLELPHVEALPVCDEDGTGQTVVIWYGISSEGKCQRKALTYHDLVNKWYLELPESWLGRVAVKQNDTTTAAKTVSATTFYQLDKGNTLGDELLTVYTLKGSGKQTFAEAQMLSILYSDTEVIYAFSLPEEAGKDGLSMTEVSEGFHMGKD